MRTFTKKGGTAVNCKINKDWFFRNLANGITLVGISLVFVIQVVFYINPKLVMTLLWLAVGVMISDFLDGKIARYFENHGYPGSVSPLGKALDRFRDKDFQISMFVYLIWHPKVDHHLKLAFSALIICEVILLATLFLAVKKRTDASATDWGKWKMTLECVAIFVCLMNLVVQDHGVKAFSGVAYSLTAIAIISFGLAVMSIKGHVEPLWQK